MTKLGKWTKLAALLMTLGGVGSAAALSPADKCEAAKNKEAGRYAFCRLKAEATAIKKGSAPDYAKCDAKFTDHWGKVETNGGGMCPTNGDQTDAQNQISAAADLIALKLTGVRFVDNGDGTVTDVETGLMWEQKDDGGGIHEKDNAYQWSTGTNKPDGTAFTDFLGTLDNGTSPDGTVVSGCFANHCDWRLPTITELQTIIDLTKGYCGGGSGACIDETVFGPTQALTYWSTTTTLGNPSVAQGVNFLIGVVGTGEPKTYNNYVRAVRAGS